MPSVKGRAVEVTRANGPFELVERDFREPGRAEVRLRIEACGLCHSDMFTIVGALPGIQFPRVPGHEIAGFVDAIGEGVAEWKIGDRAGVGWFGGNCGHCDSCRRGDFITCRYGVNPGVHYDGGWADYIIVPFSALARIPEELAAVDAGPLMCAGITTFNALRNSGARPGDVVAIQGIGGLGHLGVQFARRMGYNTVAIARGQDKAALARELGAHHYIDTDSQDAVAELNALGGAVVILSTVTSAKPMSSLIAGLAVGGKLVAVGVTLDPLEVSSAELIPQRRSVLGWPAGTSKDIEDTLKFSVLTEARPRIEEFPLEEAAAAYERMMSGNARFRVVFKMK